MQTDFKILFCDCGKCRRTKGVGVVLGLLLAVRRSQRGTTAQRVCAWRIAVFFVSGDRKGSHAYQDFRTNVRVKQDICGAGARPVRCERSVRRYRSEEHTSEL